MVTWLGTDAHGLGHPPDLRLIVPALASWAAALVALAVPAWAAWSLAGAMALAAAVVFLGGRPSALLGEAPLTTIVAALVCAATVTAVAGLHVHRTVTSAAVAAAERGGEVEFRAEIGRAHV